MAKEFPQTIDPMVVKNAAFEMGNMYAVLPTAMIDGFGDFADFATAKKAFDGGSMTKETFDQFKSFLEKKALVSAYDLLTTVNKR